MISVPLAGSLREMELAIIHETIAVVETRRRPRRILGLHRRTLYRLLEE